MIGMLEDGSALLIDGYENEAFGDNMITMYIGSSAGMPHVENSVGDKFQFSTAPIPVSTLLSTGYPWHARHGSFPRAYFFA